MRGHKNHNSKVYTYRENAFVRCPQDGKAAIGCDFHAAIGGLFNGSYFCCFAITLLENFLYVASGTIFLVTRSVFFAYGRPSTIFCA
jgi:hypothetical protein